MKLPCNVIQDLLPLVAEDLASEESKKLAEEHLAGCERCRQALEQLRRPTARPDTIDSGEALRGVKQTLRKRRIRAALLAALLVFLPLFALLARSTEQKPLADVEAVLALPPQEGEDGTLLLFYDARVTGLSTETVSEPGSAEETLLVQAWTNRWRESLPAGGEGGSMSLKTKAARVIYGYGEEQTLLYGKPMNGGVQILPRLALSYYLLLSAAAAVLLGLLWLLLRKKKAANVLRGLFFAALSYPVGQLLVKGTRTLSYSLPRDLGCILLAAAAVWGVLMLAYELVTERLSA